MQESIFLGFAKGIIARIEENRQGIAFWIALLYFVCIVKAIFGWFASLLTTFSRPVFFLAGWPLFYFNIFISLALILSFFTKETVDKTSKAVFAFSFIVIIIPIVDFIAYGPEVWRIFPMSIEEIAAQFFSLAGLLPGSVLHLGQGLTFWLAQALIAVYVFTKKGSWLKALGAMFCFYVACLALSSVPFLASILFSLGNTYNYTVIMHGLALYALSAFLLAVIWLFIYDRALLKKVVLECKPERAAHYLALVLMGWLYALTLFSIEKPNFLGLFFASFSIFLAFESALACNNLFDKELKGIKARQYRGICLSLFTLALVLAYFVGETIFALVLSTMLLGIAYSAKPISLKNLGFLNNVVIGLISALAFIVGIITQNPKIPFNATLAVFATFSLAANIKDLKDFESDKRKGIQTLPVLLGKEKGLKVIAVLSSVSFIIPAAFLDYPNLLLAGIIFGTLNFLALMKTKKETATFALYFAYALLFALSLLYRIP
ncbi:MAG: UbiA family prenyltransferase [Candidatus Diapherotrites archaeon]